MDGLGPWTNETRAGEIIIPRGSLDSLSRKFSSESEILINRNIALDLSEIETHQRYGRTYGPDTKIQTSVSVIIILLLLLPVISRHQRYQVSLGGPAARDNGLRVVYPGSGPAIIIIIARAINIKYNHRHTFRHLGGV